MNLKTVKYTQEVIETKYELPVYLYFQDEWCNDELVMITDKNKTTVKYGTNGFTIEVIEDCVIGDINLENAITTKEHFEITLNEALNDLLSYKTESKEKFLKDTCEEINSEELLEEYIIDVRCQLICNASDSYKNLHTTYNYTNKQVDDNKEYFEKCMKKGLSAYKALFFFNDYLNGEYKI